MDQPQHNTSPRFYRNAAILFFAIGGILLAMALARHDWVYWVFAAITLLNALMSVFRFQKVRETKS